MPRLSSSFGLQIELHSRIYFFFLLFPFSFLPYHSRGIQILIIPSTSKLPLDTWRGIWRIQGDSRHCLCGSYSPSIVEISRLPCGELLLHSLNTWIPLASCGYIHTEGGQGSRKTKIHFAPLKSSRDSNSWPSSLTHNSSHLKKLIFKPNTASKHVRTAFCFSFALFLLLKRVWCNLQAEGGISL